MTDHDGIKSSLPLPLLLSGIFLLAFAGCSKSYEPKSRKVQEEMFQELAGFSPSLKVTEIKYREVYQRFVMDGGWTRWLVFTHDPQAYSNLIQQTGFKQELTSMPTSASQPGWWPTKRDVFQMYVRDQESTPQDEGFSFREYVWLDTNANLVYFQKSYWD